ncbi:hypothetical protein XFF6992_160001 [Xanthomonas citri pv. fuscans]|nr:hypothetical protein XFF6992_160001 [Xanthomonas citri pv. fuscans]
MKSHDIEVYYKLYSLAVARMKLIIQIPCYNEAERVQNFV